MRSDLFVLALLCAALDCAISADVVPNSIHLALTGHPDEMVVSWFTNDNTSSSVAVFGTSPGALNRTASGTQSTFNAATGYVHDAVLTGLLPSTRYYYACGDGVTMSGQHSFVSAPADSAQTLRLAVFGDMGATHSGPVVTMLSKLIANGSVDGILHTGDISYADDVPPSHYDQSWADFFQLWQPNAMPSIPYMTAPGNHDWGCTACKLGQLPYARNFSVYKSRFRMPTVESSGTDNLWYSYDHGPYHIISFSSESNYPKSPHGGDSDVQVQWMEADLKRANLPENRAQHPWIIVMSHRPIYTSIVIDNVADRPVGECRDMQLAFEALFKKYNVDIFFNGHIHGYERMWPVYDSVVKSKSYEPPADLVHIMVGAGGSIEGFDPEIAYSQIKPSWLAYRWVNPDPISPDNWDRVGFGILTNVNVTTLNWKFYAAVSGKVVDEITITKPAPFP